MFAHHVRKGSMWNNIRLDLLTDLRPLLESISQSDKLALGKPWTKEADAKAAPISEMSRQAPFR
jgi:hypothetical protein